MIRILDGRDFDDVDVFVKELNKARLENRKQWIVYVGTVAGKRVEIKTYDVGYLQIMRVNGWDMVRVSHGLNVTGWKEAIGEAVRRARAPREAA